MTELEDLGLMRLLSPEQLERKVGAVFGQRWGRLHEQLACQRLAQLERLGHLDRGHALSAHAGHRLEQHRHAHGLVAVGIVVEVHQCGVDANIEPGGCNAAPLGWG